MSDQKFQPGNTVELIAGGPYMTVIEIDAIGEYNCEWYVGTQKHTGDFPESVLRLVTEKGRDDLPPSDF